MAFGDLDCIRSAEDRDLVLAEVGWPIGDLDGDGMVAFTDLLVLSANSYLAGNLDLVDGVQFADFLILSQNFGASVQAVAVPEPAAFGRGILFFVAWARWTRLSEPAYPSRSA